MLTACHVKALAPAAEQIAVAVSAPGALPGGSHRKPVVAFTVASTVRVPPPRAVTGGRRVTMDQLADVWAHTHVHDTVATQAASRAHGQRTILILIASKLPLFVLRKGLPFARRRGIV